MTVPYLSKTGLAAMWALAKQKFLEAGATAVKAQSLFYGTTSNSTTAMTVNISGITSYYVGLTVILKMGAAPASGCTVNINGIGAKTLKWRAQTSGAYFTSGATYLFIYDGTYFTAIHSYDSDTTYGVVSTSANGLAPKRTGTTTKFLRDDGTWAIPPDTNTTYGAATTTAAGLMSATDKTQVNGTVIAAADIDIM